MKIPTNIEVIIDENITSGAKENAKVKLIYENPIEGDYENGDEIVKGDNLVVTSTSTISLWELERAIRNSQSLISDIQNQINSLNQRIADIQSSIDEDNSIINLISPKIDEAILANQPINTPADTLPE